MNERCEKHGVTYCMACLATSNKPVTIHVPIRAVPVGPVPDGMLDGPGVIPAPKEQHEEVRVDLDAAVRAHEVAVAVAAQSQEPELPVITAAHQLADAGLDVKALQTQLRRLEDAVLETRKELIVAQEAFSAAKMKLKDLVEAA